MSQAIVDFVGDFIDNMNYTQGVLSFTTGGGNTTLKVANLIHSRAGLTMTVDGVDFEILSVDRTLSTFTIGEVLTTATLATIQTPFYFHGTPYAVNADQDYIDGNQKFPFIYLVEIIEENIIVDPSAKVDSTTRLLFFFIDEADKTDGTTDIAYAGNIPAMRSLADKFIFDIQDQPRVNKLTDDITIIPHVKFGEFTNLKGHLNSLINASTDAIELQITLPLSDDCIGIDPFTCKTLCEQVAGNTSQSTVDCIDNAGKTAEVQALICVPCPPVGGIAYRRPFLTGADVSYATGDDKDNFDNGVYDYTPPSNPIHCATLDFNAVDPFLTLLADNFFGNRNRFTDTVGGQEYGSGGNGSLLDYSVCNLTGLAFITNIQVRANWAVSLSNANAATNVGFSDWRMPNINEGLSLLLYNASIARLAYSPFAILSVNIWSCTSNDNSGSTDAIWYSSDPSDSAARRRIKTSTGVDSMIVRNHEFI